MSFWNWRRGGGATTAGTSAVALGTDLAPIELYTADARIVGWISSGGQRVTDLLNEQTALRLWRPSPGPVDGAHLARPITHDAPPAPDASGEWQELPTDQVVLAMPPEWRAARQLRLHRKLRRVAMTAGDFSVTGNLHVAPGTEPGPHLLRRGARFMPLTEAYLLHNADPPFEHVVSVVIVNTAHVTQLTTLVTLA